MVRPRTIYFCTIRLSSSCARCDDRRRGHLSPQHLLVGDELDAPTVTGKVWRPRASADVERIPAEHEPQDDRDREAGRLSGRITRVRTPNHDAPSIFAASWISTGISMKKLRSIQMVKGRVIS